MVIELIHLNYVNHVYQNAFFVIILISALIVFKQCTWMPASPAPSACILVPPATPPPTATPVCLATTSRLQECARTALLLAWPATPRRAASPAMLATSSIRLLTPARSAQSSLPTAASARHQPASPASKSFCSVGLAARSAASWSATAWSAPLPLCARSA